LPSQISLTSKFSLHFGLTQKRFLLAKMGHIAAQAASLRLRRMNCSLAPAGFGYRLANLKLSDSPWGYAQPVDCHRVAGDRGLGGFGLRRRGGDQSGRNVVQQEIGALERANEEKTPLDPSPLVPS
jgi:hypothetical protein